MKIGLAAACVSLFSALAGAQTTTTFSSSLTDLTHIPGRLIALTLTLAFTGDLRAQVDVLTANYDNGRTSQNLNEAVLNTNNVNATQFGKLYAFAVDGQVYAQPLYVHALSVPDKGTLNVLYVATMHNSVYAFDADAGTGSPLWQVNLGTTVDPASFNVAGAAPYTDILHEIGILSTPVIDRSGGTIYVVSETAAGGADSFWLHALDLTTGAEKLNGPVQIQASVAGAGWQGMGDAANGQLSLIAASHLQRTGLLLANGAIYIGFGSHGDFPPWHGWIVAYNAADLRQQTAAFNTTPSTAGSAIWQGGRGLAADPNGDVYCSTGNGNYDGVVSWGESVLHLSSALGIVDWFTPAEYAGWTNDDLDLGSNGPIPGAGNEPADRRRQGGIGGVDGPDQHGPRSGRRCRGAADVPSHPQHEFWHVQLGAVEPAGRSDSLYLGITGLPTRVPDAERAVQQQGGGS
jgi:hypothetical protein